MAASSGRRAAVLLLLLALSPLLARFYAQNERLGSLPETISAGVTAHAVVHAGTLDIAPYYPPAARSATACTACSSSRRR